MDEIQDKYGYILNSRISALTFIETVDLIKYWINNKSNKYICVCNTHSLVTASKNPLFYDALEKADLCVPDGMPLVWAQRLNGFKNQDRVDGPKLMLELCKLSSREGYRIYLYGSTNKTLDLLEKRLKSQFKDLQIVGKFSPPFRKTSEEEENFFVQEINKTNPDIVFVGLGCPKQELWMYSKRHKVKGIMIGVGAAFDFISGNLKRPPLWVQNLGFEWLYRLACEPKRLWKRYAYNNSMFIYKYILTFKNNRRKTQSIIKKFN